MNFIKIAILALFAVVAISLIKELKAEFALVLSIGVSVVILLSLLDNLFNIIQSFYTLSEQAQLDGTVVGTVIKVIGIGYLGEFTNNICLDANCKNIGDKVLLASKISILLCALPVIQKLFEALLSLNI